MTTVERIKSICNEKKISISKLEKECGFSNGYLSHLSKGSLPDDRLNIIANYLNVSIVFLIYGYEADILKDLDMQQVYYVKKNITDVKFAFFVDTLKRYYMLENPMDKHLKEMESDNNVNILSGVPKSS